MPTYTVHTDAELNLLAQLDRQSRLVDYLCARLTDAERHERHTGLNLTNLLTARHRYWLVGEDFTDVELDRLEQVRAIAEEATRRANEIRRLTYAAAVQEGELERQIDQIGGL